jgi:hypothetical protein
MAFAWRGDSGAIVTVAAFSRTAGAVGAGWNRLPGFWRAQIVGWGLFAVVDLVNLTLLYRDLPVALGRTAAVVTCLVLLSTAMRRVYASRHFDNTLSAQAVAWIALLSSAAAVSSRPWCPRPACAPAGRCPAAMRSTTSSSR